MNWYEWETQEEFDLWHNALCAELGYPLTSINQATGKPDKTATKTTSYTNSYLVDGKIIADVADEYAEGLTLTILRVPQRDFSGLS
jgi:hypothetical protein